MPIYEYVCNDCGHEFEALQKMSDAPLSTCPGCTRDTLRKKISAAAFRLSGSGWYETDFKSDKQKNVLKGDATGKADNKKDDKPAKSDAKAGSGDKEAVA